jgi:prepilin-type N-terminal cleavage/methylation domain-containing protein
MTTRCRDERGFSLIEILTVMVMIGIIVAMGIPKFGNTLARQNVRGARVLITTLHSRARNSAISRSRTTKLAIKNGYLLTLSANPLTGVIDTVGRRGDSVAARYGVTYSVVPSTRDTLVFDPRGLGTEATSTTIYVSKSGFADTITISPLGRIQH